MKDQAPTKLFAFKLANTSDKSKAKWAARDGVSVAGCTRVSRGQVAAPSYRYGRDGGAYC